MDHSIPNADGNKWFKRKSDGTLFTARASELESMDVVTLQQDGLPVTVTGHPGRLFVSKKELYFDFVPLKTITITGRTGVGKSRLMESLYKHNRMAVVDPLAKPPLEWSEPDPNTCDGVVIDHVWYLDNGKETVAAIVAWCEKHNVPLWVVDQHIADLNEKGISLPDDAFELNLLGPDDAIATKQSDKGVNVTYESGVAIAKKISGLPV